VTVHHLMTISRIIIGDHQGFLQLARFSGPKLGGDEDSVLGLIVGQFIDKVCHLETTVVTTNGSAGLPTAFSTIPYAKLESGSYRR
jgi:hypothetical protein